MNQTYLIMTTQITIHSEKKQKMHYYKLFIEFGSMESKTIMIESFVKPDEEQLNSLCQSILEDMEQSFVSRSENNKISDDIRNYLHKVRSKIPRQYEIEYIGHIKQYTLNEIKVIESNLNTIENEQPFRRAGTIQIENKEGISND